MVKFSSRGGNSNSNSNNHGRDIEISSSPHHHQLHNQNSSSPAFVSGMGAARPVRLVCCDEKGKFQIDPQAVTTLQLVKGPIGVVSVCGRARQGKSFILNQLLGRSSGFQVASTHRPCTKGLWMWSAPIKRTALDGAEYSLILLDSEGIDAYDQTGTYSTQIFSLAVLLSSMFIYNQMGGIDEAALDHLSLVTEMTKHIRVRASGGMSTASELGQFSPTFVWLLRDFYLELEEDNRKITPRDYLELALSPVQGGGEGISAKNEIRESIRALFPDRECFTLVQPLNDEMELQRLDQISVDKLRPEFISGLESLTNFIFERTRPKQIGSATMTGPILAGITQSFLQALNNGAVPTIASSWQVIEQTECRRAYDSAAEVYMSSFDRSRPDEEVSLGEAHEEAVQKSLVSFNASAVGSGLTRQKYENLLRTFFRKAFEDHRRNVFLEADLRCSRLIQGMEKRLRAACHDSNANIDHVVKVLDGMLSEYETTAHGPAKWQKLATFLQQSLEGLISDLAKKQLDQARSDKAALSLRCRSIEDKMGLLNKQIEASEKNKSEYLQCFEDAINDKKKLTEDYTRSIANLQSQCSTLEERSSSLLKAVESAKRDSFEWKRKYEQVTSKKKAEIDQVNAEISALLSRISSAEARLAAAREQIHSAEEEAMEWKRKFDFTSQETKAALDKAATIQVRVNTHVRLKEDVVRAKFTASLSAKDEEIIDKAAKLEYAEKRLTTASLELQAAESKLKSYEMELSPQKLEIEELREKLESVKVAAQSFERNARVLEQEKIYLEQKYLPELKRFEEAQERCRVAEKDAKRATELADTECKTAVIALREKNEVQRLAMERVAHIERQERRLEGLKRQKADLLREIQNIRESEMDAVAKVGQLEARVEEREQEIDSLLKSNNEQRVNTVQVLENLLKAERASRAEANRRAETLSLQLQSTQSKLDLLQQDFTSARLIETALDSKLRTASRQKRSRPDDYEWESVLDMDIDENIVRERKRSKSTATSSPFKNIQVMEGGGSDINTVEEANLSQGLLDYTKFTVVKLRQEITRHGFGADLLQLKSATKKDVLNLYEKRVLGM
ncbi:guanylate-binding protein 7-like [Papaver somniferum]|uniref:guanylate-binding protein 7-like n=1 Tax=Papaver somniferum TaxID=3469 RepID=UPI000E6FCC12|nr:guanylate-binding protein 7-like [Papaver somniferum]